MKVKKLILGFFNVNCYIVSGKDMCFIIDPGAGAEEIGSYIKLEGLKPEFILNTHGHFDHMGAVPDVMAKYNIPFYIDPDDEFIITDPDKNFSSVFTGNPLSLETYNLISKKDFAFFEKKGIKTYKMPGHTPGSIIIEIQDCLFTGDLLFRGGVGRTDLAGGNMNTLIESLKKLKFFNSSFKIFPGHGASSTLDYEFANNYYLSEDFLEGGASWI